MLSGILFLILINFSENFLWQSQHVLKWRNFYGMKTIYEKEGARFFMHGTTIHGVQYLDETKAKTPLAYFSNQSGVGELLTDPHFYFRRVGALGLGLGSIASYFKKGESVDFFELDPLVVSIAQNHFSFLQRSEAFKRFFLGDARLSLEGMPAQLYDLLIIDVFSGDSIPVHLLTQEALLEYKRHLNPRGIIVFHLSNRYFDCRGALFKTALAAGATPCFKSHNSSSSVIFPSTWAALTWDQEAYRTLISKSGWQEVNHASLDGVKAFTDQYSTLLPYIKLSKLRWWGR